MFEMRALTLVQPWGTAIMELGKDVENRAWAPPSKLLGRRIAVHAGVKVDAGDAWGLLHELRALDLARLPTGVILGTVELVGFVGTRCGRAEAASPADMLAVFAALDSRWRAPDSEWLWVVRNPRPLDRPIPAKGALGLWRLPDELAVALHGLADAEVRHA